MSNERSLALAAGLIAFASGTALAAAPPEGTAIRTVAFHREVVNLEQFRGPLTPYRAAAGESAAPFSGDVWHGAIARQLPGDGNSSHAHDVPFAVLFKGGQVVHARADANANGSLADDADAKLSLYPGDSPGRSFLVRLSERVVRVVVPQSPSDGGERSYVTQEVYGMLGAVSVDGTERAALLYDANADGAYTKGTGDGLFVDLDGDRHFAIDVMADEFGSFGAPFNLGRESVAFEEVDPSGARLRLRTLGPAVPMPLVESGHRVPEFALTATDGSVKLLSAQRGSPVVVYFWSSTSGSCREAAAAVRGVYEHFAPAGVLFFGVSYDTDKTAMERFRRENGQTWPTSFSGGIPAEDPIGRLFREREAGTFYVIDAEGRLKAAVRDAEALTQQLAALTAAATVTRRRPRRLEPSRPRRPGEKALRGTRGRPPAAARPGARIRGRAR